MRTIFYDPASTVCRPIVQFLLEHEIEAELVHVDLTLGEHCSDWYAAINPNRQVPALKEGDFVLTESAAILRYLATLADSPAYPAEPRARAKVDEAIDWFNTGFYRDHGYGLVYATIFDKYRVPGAELGAALHWYGERAARRLEILDREMIGNRTWLAGDTFTIADMFGAALVTIGDLIGADLSPYPNVRRWLAAVEARPSWAEANAAFFGWRSALRAEAQAA